MTPVPLTSLGQVTSVDGVNPAKPNDPPLEDLSYTYDSADRLTLSADLLSGDSESDYYDGDGNLTSKIDTGVGTTSYG